ncbi:MAG TPA: sugar phosphate isomerase/epimerase [Thermomicrobiales bacterium]|nr:sugar phosphate isomerase/epimerase [Thermomicrobiales bacterium]
MKLGFASLIGTEPIPFPDLLWWAAANGFQALEVNVGSNFAPIGDATYPGHLDIARIANEGPGELTDLIAGSGVDIASLAPMINLLTADLDLRAKRIGDFRNTIDACQKLGVDTIVTFTGSSFGMNFYGLPGVGDGHASNHVGDNLRIFTEVYGPLADYAGERGVRIAFETAGRGGPEGNLAHSPELWEAMFAAVPSKALGLSFDPSHLVWLGVPNIPDVIREFGARIYHFDGKDTEIMRGRLARQGILGSGWWRYRLPGMGELDWSGIFSALGEIGYEGIIAIENEDPLVPGLAGVRWAGDYLRTKMLPSQLTSHPTADRQDYGWGHLLNPAAAGKDHP